MSNTDKYDLPVEHPVSSNKESSHPGKSLLETPPHTSDKTTVSSLEPKPQEKTSNTNKGLKGSIHYPGVSDESRGRVQEPPEMV